MNKTFARESNIELLRLVCILFITVHHFLCHGIAKGVHPGDVMYMNIFWSINGFLYIGVNVFALISGYFGIKFKWRKIFELYIIMAIYGLAIGLVGMQFKGDFSYNEIRRTLLMSILPFSHSELWFIESYVMLMFLAPILNAAMNNLSKRQYLFSVILLCIVNLYFGYFWQVEFSGNTHGFTLMQLVWMYFIAGYIKRFVPIDDFLDKRHWLITIYVVCSVIYSIFSILAVPHWNGWRYNNPILVISSISFFIFFLTLNIKSRAINFAASSVFAVYISQGYMDKSFNFYRRVGHWCFDYSSGILPVEFILTLVVAFIFILFVIVFDKFRSWLTNPVLRIFTNVFPE